MRVKTMSDKALSTRVKVIERSFGQVSIKHVSVIMLVASKRCGQAHP